MSFSGNTVDITLYLVGEDEDDAQSRMPWPDFESAVEYQDSEGGVIYSVTATIDFDTIEVE